ncbi:ras guanine nucleotide exchange factor domain-containing protein [Mycena pura]|uniref:Ras guanine nucleotide exchange factor domain-containing protein n=1 Tax=Mycena pura TaxID=153505 RepID=A0AAD6UTG8_9AGAR|nr:ras guanine nucleotide exchange factor domain-containing protein [Mycena pura]
MESILHGIRDKLQNRKSVNILSSVLHQGEMKGWINSQHQRIEDAFRTMTTKFLVAQANQIGESRAIQALDIEDMRGQLTELLAVFLRSHFNSEAPLDLKPVGQAINIISAPGSHTTTFTESYPSSSRDDFGLPPIAGPSRAPPTLPPVAGLSRTTFTLEDILAPNPSTAKAPASEVVSPQPVPPAGPICRKVDGNVVSGNLLGLVDHLITDTDDQDFRKVMLDTYRAYATPDDVFAILKARFEKVQPEIGPHYYLTRSKIIEVIVAWIQTVPPESNLLRQVASFASTTRNRLIEVHQKKIQRAVDNRSRKTILGPSKQESVPDEAHKLALALTFIEIDIRKTARWSDYLLYEQGSKTTYIATMERENEKMIRWLRYSILRHKDIRDRADAIKLLAKTAQECRDMQNYNSMAAIASVLDWKAKPMTDLPRTTDRLSSHMRAIKVLAEAINPDENYKAYKDIRRRGDRNRIPWLVVELLEVKELLSSKKYPSTVYHETNQLINFERYRQLALKIPRYQIPPELEADRNAAHIAYLSNQFDSVKEIDLRRLKHQEEKDYRDRKVELQMLGLG